MISRRSALMLSGLLLASTTHAFQADVSRKETLKALDVLTVNDLAVGEKGLLTMYMLDFCKDSKNQLQALSLSKLDSEPAKYSYAIEVRREKGGHLTVHKSSKGKPFDHEGVKDMAGYLGGARACEEENEVIPVSAVFGYASTSALLESITSPKISEMVAQEKTESKWYISESKSEFDDSPSVTMMLNSNGIGSRTAGDETLVYRCKENKTEAYIVTDEYLGSELYSVKARFDKEEAYSQSVSLSTDSKAVFIRKPISFIKTALPHEKLVVRYSSYRGTSFTATFELSGAEDGVQKLRTACNW